MPFSSEEKKIRRAATNRKYAKAHPEKMRANWRRQELKRRGTEKYAVRLREAQRKRAGVSPTRPEPEFCECCGRPPNGRGTMRLNRGTMHLDHCHETGVFRGWLCHSCNTGLGLLGDNLVSVLRVTEYLKRVVS